MALGSRGRWGSSAGSVELIVVAPVVAVLARHACRGRLWRLGWRQLVGRRDIAHLVPHVIVVRLGDVAILEELDDGKNLVGVLLLLGAGDTVLVQNLLPLGGHARICRVRPK
jgi:hypothetical protein